MSEIKEYTDYYDNGQLCRHYFLKDNDLCGEYKSWYEDGTLWEHSFRKDGFLHGESKWWHENGQSCEHCFYQHNKNITNKVKEVVSDIRSITSEEKLMIKLKFGIDCS